MAAGLVSHGLTSAVKGQYHPRRSCDAIRSSKVFQRERSIGDAMYQVLPTASAISLR